MWEPLCWSEHCDLVLVKKKFRGRVDNFMNLSGLSKGTNQIWVCESRAKRIPLGSQRLWAFKVCKRERVSMQACQINLYAYIPLGSGHDHSLVLSHSILFAQVLNSSIFWSFFFFLLLSDDTKPTQRPHWVGVTDWVPQREAAVLRVLHREAV